jgi:hypothetical protein
MGIARLDFVRDHRRRIERTAMIPEIETRFPRTAIGDLAAILASAGRSITIVGASSPQRLDARASLPPPLPEFWPNGRLTGRGRVVCSASVK